jgi:hypothetical protein
LAGLFVFEAGDHVTVVLARAQQLGVGADRGDATGLQERHAVGEGHRRRTVGDDEGRRLVEDLAQGVLDEGLGVDVERRQGIVEHEHRRAGRDGTGEGEPLTLTARERQTLFADHGVRTVGEVVDEARLGDAESLAHDRLGLGTPRDEVFATEEDVVAHRLREQRRVLEGHADLRAQLVEREIPHVDAVEGHPALRDVVQACRQRREGRLAGTGEADQRHGLAGLELEVDAVEQVAEMDALEPQRAARLGGGDRVLGVDDRVLLVEDLEDAVGGRPRVEEEREQEADRLHRPAQHGRHREERDELGDLQLSGLDEEDADAEAQREGDVGQEHQPEPDPADRTRLAELGLPEGLGLAGELLQGVLAAAEGLEDADAVHGLLDRGGEVARLVLALPRERAVRLLEPVAGVPQRRADDEERRPQQPVPAEQEHRADEDRQHVHDEEHEAERHPAAHHADVLHHAAQQLAGLPLVVERHGQALEALVEPGAQVVLDLGGGSHDEEATRPHHQRLEEPEDEDGDRAPGELGEVSRGDGPLDDDLEHERDRQREQARDERADGAEHQARQHRLGERVEPGERPESGQTWSGGGSLGGRGHDP